MNFYPDVKDGLSPSALAQWRNQRSAFVKSYFQQERGPETKAMQAGTEIHALIEAGIIKAQKDFDYHEKDLSVTIGEGRVFRGRPDSFSKVKAKRVRFVDYKSGKANDWKEKLPTDVKMRATAWLVWKESKEPEEVEGHIEYFQTTWDPEQRKVVPVDDTKSEVISIIYTDVEMAAFTQVILKAMDEINAFYERWLTSTGEFVNKSDVEAYIDLRAAIEQKEALLDELGERILSQMEVGGSENHKVPGIGTFYVRETRAYDYPENLPVKYADMEITLDSADGITAAAKAAKKNYELMTDPKSVVRSVSFRAAKEK